MNSGVAKDEVKKTKVADKEGRESAVEQRLKW